ncbi:uncharacterized protein K460DRAFT_127088 [Cucurbitaria berberidis CBS 394.84]|uniref:Uncharacterized protein n=1 Tax=Cucurbitaria berberidis CBS 394.84 TaxID=1168544 RepID=A0A9P4GJN2_9PLEO|nr:uncharacterized protein K460DRAFT_127088 [Cucurbitaria berberidis CBS 394.84]KAF1846616.1 hypothetical protein K460DRAFT_127088 [Cucurbitaria berberidis CBS 394.84]
MPHDANFAGDRLRLASFLRVMEKGMPQRPSRFKQRLQGVDQPDTSRPFSPGSLGLTNTVEEAAIAKGTEAFQVDDNQMLVVNGDIVHGNPRSPASSKPRGVSSARKRHLPVQELALLRTTTSDGLPEPSDANTVFAAPITDVDPIEDSQVKTSLIVLEDKAISKQRTDPSPCKARKPTEGRFTSIRPTNSPTRIYQRLPVLSNSNSKQKSQLCFARASDGFIGSERGFVMKKRPRPRRKAAPVGKRLAQVGGLTLASGFLPVPALVSMERINSPCLDQSHVPVVLEHFQERERSGQLPMARRQSGVEVESTTKQRSQQWDKTVYNQLSSITAPVRRFSESSESVSPAEENCWCSEDDSDIDTNNGVNGARFLHLGRTPSFADDTSYFEHAMHHLGFAEGVYEKSWSQYNMTD